MSTPQPAKPKILLAMAYLALSAVASAMSALESTDERAPATPFTLSQDEISQVATLAGVDFASSPFAASAKDDREKKILGISDFNNLSDFELDTHLLARELVGEIKDSKNFALTTSISGNAFNADPMLDKIRALRNNAEFQNIVGKGKLLPPQYSLSATITSDRQIQSKLHIITYHFIFSIVNLENGLVEWDYIEHIKKVSKDAPPSSQYETKQGRICTQSSGKNAKNACEIAISEIWLGVYEQIPQNKKELLHTYAFKACGLDSAFGCRALGASYKFLKQDFKAAKTYYEKSCENSDGGGCYNLSILYEYAQGVPQDIALAKKYAKRACDYGFKAGCENLAHLQQYSENESLNEEAMLVKKDCEMGIGMGCERLAFSYYHGLNGANKNLTQARILHQKSCDLGDPDGCYQLGLWDMQGLGGMAKNSEKGREYTQKACESEPKKACKILQKFDTATQERYGSKYNTCEQRAKVAIDNACMSLGGIYEHIFNDSAMGLKYYKKACDSGIELSCAHYQNLQQKVK